MHPAEHEKLDVISIGGKLGKNSNVHTGASVISQLADIKVDLCIIGANGISMAEGLTDSDWEIVQVIKAMIRIFPESSGGEHCRKIKYFATD